MGTTRWMLVLGLGLVGVGLAPHEVQACGNGVEERLNEIVTNLAKAERDVNQGRPLQAGRTVLATYPNLRKLKPARNGPSDRAMRTMALAIVRTEAKLDLKPGFSGATQEQRAGNLVWAQRMLRAFSQRSGRDAAAETAYAEAIALSPARRAEAMRILTRLSRADLLTSPQGYATLSRLYEPVEEPGTPAFLHAARITLNLGRQRLADDRCRRMAGEAQTICMPLES